MSYAADYASHRIAAEAAADARATFIRRTYAHLAGAILAFILLETFLVNAVPEDMILGMFTTRFSWLIVLGAFMAVSFIADRWARSDTSVGLQYLGLALYVVAEAVIFLPLLFIAAKYAAPDVIPKAGILTLTIFGGLTVATLVTRNDFSYLRTILSVGSCLALGVVIVGVFMGVSLGLWFSFAMVALACGFILYETSNVLHYYRTDQYVAASLTLFASVALLFWYILRIVMATSNRN
jgi:FtsH-binding integral membrane protein